ncbi:MAG TPA: ferredoxin, partial [Polyangia bacterium]|nr:ferredoxin [Polyangia bacterium]
MRVTVDRSKCCGAGQCVLLAPKVFDQSEDGIVILLDETPPKDLHAAMREAAKMCPTA